jgi:hypothetical protein
MIKTLLPFFIIICWSAGAQTIVISAKLVDKETKEPIIFATVGIMGKSLGTISNMQGDFDFYFPAEFQNENLIVSTLGYNNFEAPIWSLIANKNLLIEMTKSTIVLHEVVVSDSLKGGEILNIALSRIPQNFPMTPYMVDGFYRDLKKVGGVYISLLEAAVKIYDEDYKAPRNKFKLRERVALLEVRRSLGYTNKFTAYFDDDNLLEDLLLHNNVRYRQFPDESFFFSSLKREKDSYYNGHEIFVVSQNRDYKLIVYIDKRTYSIIHLEYENNQEETIGSRSGLVSKFVSLKRIIDFREYKQKMYLNFITVDSRVNWYDGNTGELKFETGLHQQLLVNNINPEPEERIGTTEKMRSYGLQHIDFSYNKIFWDNYNIIKESPLDKKIIEDLEKAGSLEKQFEKN